MVMHTYSTVQRQVLLQIGYRSIAHGLRCEQPLSVVLEDYDVVLCAYRGCFVTLHLRGELRGCIGSLEPTAPLAEAVSRQSFGAAFRDPRFHPLSVGEQPDISLSISVLSELEAMTVHSEQDLLAQLRPGIDGLLITAGDKRATFLPAVWASLPEPGDFVAELKRKAGLGGEWTSEISVSHYTTESF